MESKTSNKKVTIALILISVTGILLLFLHYQECFSKIPYFFTELLAIVINLFMFIFVLIIIAWIVSLFSLKKAKPFLINIFSLLAVVLTICAVIVFFNGWTTSGYYSDINKQEINGKYYIMLENKRISVTKEQYEYIDSSKSYSIAFKWNEILPIAKVLEVLEDGDESKGVYF